MSAASAGSASMVNAELVPASGAFVPGALAVGSVGSTGLAADSIAAGNSAPSAASHSSQLHLDVFGFHSPAWRRTLENFDKAVAYLELDTNVLARLRRPERVLIVSVPIRRDSGHVEVFTGYRVQHNSACGPYKGGIRFAPQLDVGEMSALAMEMTWKTSLIGLPLGGAKGGVAVDPRQLSEGEMESLTRRYTTEILRVIGPEIDIPAPDMGTSAKHMAWIMDTYSAHVGHTTPGVVTGKPIALGGSQLRAEATGKGVVYSIEEACRHQSMDLSKCRFVVQGLGNVGSVAALELCRRGATCVAMSDVAGGIVNTRGIDVSAALKIYERAGTVAHCELGDTVGPSEVLAVPCDIVVPAAAGGVIDDRMARRMSCRIVAEGANHPTTPQADAVFEQTGVFVIPDVLCNAGGVTVSYFEWVQGGMHFFWSAEEIDQRLNALLRNAFRQTVEFARHRRLPMRLAAWCLGIQNVERVMKMRGMYA